MCALVGKGGNSPSAHFLNICYEPGAIVGGGHGAGGRALGFPALVKFAFQWEKTGSKRRLLVTLVWGGKCCGERISRVSGQRVGLNREFRGGFSKGTFTETEWGKETSQGPGGGALDRGQ